MGDNFKDQFVQLNDSFVQSDFGTALRHLKAGGKAARAGWNGKGMYIYLEFQHLGISTGAAAHGNVHYEPFIVMFTAQGKHQPGWLASQPDMLATDWHAVP